MKEFMGEILCLFNRHDWRYASRYTKPGFESRARCQRCDCRQWVPVDRAAGLTPHAGEKGENDAK